MVYTILFTDKAKKDIIRLRKSGEKLALKKLIFFLTNWNNIPLQEPDTPNLWEKTGQDSGRGELLINTALFIKLKKGR